MFTHGPDCVAAYQAGRHRAFGVLDHIGIHEGFHSSFELIISDHMGHQMFTLVIEITAGKATNKASVAAFVSPARHGRHVFIDFTSQFILFI